MRRAATSPSWRRRRVVWLLAVVLAGLVPALGIPGSGGPSRAAGQSSGGEVTPQTDASIPATHVTMFGASPKEAENEVWGFGREDGKPALVRYTAQSGWSLGPELLDTEGKPLSEFKLDQPEAFKYDNPSPLAGQMTADGSGVLAGEVPSGSSGETAPVLLARNPGGSFQEIAALPATGEAALAKSERLLGRNRAPLVAALEEPPGQGGAGAHAGVLVVPVNEEGGVEDRVLHWNGEQWSSESIEVPQESRESFQVLAIAASSPDDAWLLASLSSRYPSGSVALFRRKPASEGTPATWQLVSVAPRKGGEAATQLQLPVESSTRKEAELLTVPARDQSQVLTVTSEGVWVEGQRSDVQTDTTMYVKPEGEAGGYVAASWCRLPAGTSASTLPCSYQLPEVLADTHVRSFAWPGGGGPYGERVMTGFYDGVSLRLEGSTFVRVLALGGSPEPKDVGGTFGSAFVNAHEGWLGQELLPVHLTLDPVASRLTPWPVSFRHALLALAGEPEQSVGALASEALAVGDEGEVARYEPGKGWLPESLLGPGGHRETPILRAVAWPSANRAYAVGDEGPSHSTQMWLWRGETGLWEPDPAMPLNFHGDLLGIAFEPGNRARGYAVGQAGVLLSYGKTWTQEPEEAIPAAARGANFTSVAFAGSEAIVAYRRLIPSSDRFEGGLIVNNGSGWRIDAGAAAVMNGNAPWAVAALPDGGAAFTASGVGEGGHVYERETASSAWQETATPYPGESAPGSIALFRENGALRVVAASSVPDTIGIESEPSPPPGFPPTLVQPYPLPSNQDEGVMRQTATGWSDEEHELNNAEEPPGEYERYDSVYRPDPVAAVLVDEGGSQGWAVGGVAANEGENSQMDTSDIWRYPADGSTPLGAGTAAVAAESSEATFAIGAGSQCDAPCAARAKARIGPDVWLANALSEAARIHSVRAFVYAGPRVTTGKTAGPATLAVPYAQEQERYAQVLAGAGSLPVYVAASSTDLDQGHSENAFDAAFEDFDKPFGNAGALAAGTGNTSRGAAEGCAAPVGCDYYAFDSSGTGGTVRVIVLDEDTAVSGGQVEWLERQLGLARTAGHAAIVIGNDDLQTLVAAHEGWAERVVEALVAGDASAYFFDAPEQDVEGTLQSPHGGTPVPAFGAGTLGYISYASQELSDFIGASGFMLTEVGAEHREADGHFPVSVKLIPDIGELALEGEEGTLLKRSAAALFQGLARRPRAGNDIHNRALTPETDPYIPIPLQCTGADCGEQIPMEYTFSSSNPKIGNFVKQNLTAEPKGRQPLYNAKQEAIQEPTSGGTSGLFCAFNPGTTIVTISAGGLSASLPVTIESGSVRQPCGTVQAESKPASQTSVTPSPPPTTAPATSAPASAPPVLPVPPPPAAVVPKPAPRATPTPLPPFFVNAALPAFVPPFVPPPVPTPARPTPPSGTSAVTSPVEAPEKEEEQEAAPESVSNEAVAYREGEHDPLPEYVLGVILLAAFAGASARRRPGRRRRELRIAPATVSGARGQLRMSRGRGRRM